MILPRILLGLWFLLITPSTMDEQPVPALTRDEPIVRMVLQETNGEPFMGMVAVAAVALDRVVDSRWPDTDHGVIYQRHQFTSMTQRLRRYTNAQISMARRAVADARAGMRPCGVAYWYHATWMPQRPRWAVSATHQCIIGNHAFYGGLS